MKEEWDSLFQLPADGPYSLNLTWGNNNSRSKTLRMSQSLLSNLGVYPVLLSQIAATSRLRANVPINTTD